MQEALRSLNEVSSNVATPKTIKKNITDMSLQHWCTYFPFSEKDVFSFSVGAFD